MFKHNRGYTLVEMLMATVLTLMMMSAVVRLFESVGKGITGSRAMLETNDRLRMAALQLQRDLAGVTVTMLPPRRPGDSEGYFEYMEGPIGPVFRPEAIARDFDKPRTVATGDQDQIAYEPDTTIADNDDILLFTTRTDGEPFRGRCSTATAESNVAEVAWFIRGRTLYRRVLLVAPNSLIHYPADTSDADTNNDGVINHVDSSLPTAASYYSRFDISARPVFRDTNGTQWIGNTLADLTKRENRFAHSLFATYRDPTNGNIVSDTFPYNAGRWGQLGLPVLAECAASSAGSPWMDWTGTPTFLSVTYTFPMDYWHQPHPWTSNVNATTGTSTSYTNASFLGEDVAMTNVIGFDVKAWDPNAPVIMYNGTALVPGDPGYLYAVSQLNASNPYTGTYYIIHYGAYVDLNYMCQLGAESSPDGTDPSAPYPAYNDRVKGTGLNTGLTPPPRPYFFGAGASRSGLRGVTPFSKTNLDNPFATSDLLTGGVITSTYLGYSTYDTWSTHYEYDGVQQNGSSADSGTNGVDDNGDGVVDDPGEADTLPPYPVPLRGIQVTIRVYEPSTRKIIQRTIHQDFLVK